MGLRISTNLASLTAQRNLVSSQNDFVRASRALSSGSRIANPGDDAAGFAIAENLRGQASGLKQAKMNADNAEGLIQTAEGGLNEQNNILVRLRELAVQSASDTVGDNERDFLNTEFTNLVSEFDRIAQTTRYGNQQLLVGVNKDYQFQLGTSNTDADVVTYRLDTDTRAQSVRIKGLDVSDRGDARDAIDDLDEAMNKVAKARAGFGAMQSRFEIASNNLAVQYENIQAAHSRIADADIAEEASNLASAQVRQEYGVSVLAQANQSTGRALKLLT